MNLSRPDILIVDDEVTNIKILGSILENEYDIRVATSGEQALDLVFRKKHPDIILLDIELPGISGFQVAERLKADQSTQQIPIIFVSSHSEEEDEKKGLELGAVDFISKPFRRAIVRVRLKNHLELKQQRDRLAHLSRHDGLTGIPNRQFFDENLNSEWRRACRSGSPLTLILVDIDFFKQFNDYYGHVAGDRCLCRVAQSLDDLNQRASDLTGRYGGEEFAMLLPGVELEDGRFMAEKARQTILALSIPHAYSAAAECVTASFGVARSIPMPGQSPVSLIEAADHQLYLAKKAGRNCVCV